MLLLRRRAGWLALVVLALALAAGVVVGAQIALRGRSLGTAGAAGSEARATFVIAAAVSPAPSPSPGPVEAAPTGTAVATGVDEYVVQPGDTLRSIAEQEYGDAAQWSRIYDANRDAIGSNPDAISAGMQLQIPRP